MRESILQRPENRARLMSCYVFGAIRDLPDCSVAAIAHLASIAGVDAPICDNPECEHPKLPLSFGQNVPVGTPVGTIIAQIEEFVWAKEGNAAPF